MKYLLCALFALALTGCGSTLKVTKPEANGYYKTAAKIKQENILVSEKVDIKKYRPMFFAKLDEKNAKYEDFFSSSIKNTGYFDKVVTKADLEQIIMSKGLADKVTSVSDMIGLHHAEKNLGPFLVGDLTTEWKGGYNFEADLKVVDPADGKVVFQVHNSAFNWDGLDQPLFLPMFNAFIDWAKSNSN